MAKALALETLLKDFDLREIFKGSNRTFSDDRACSERIVDAD